MKYNKAKFKDFIETRMKDDQVKTFTFLMVKSALVSIAGFVFWIVVARLFSDDIVGKGTIALSLLNTISHVARLGFDVTAMKYIPENKEQVPSKINMMIVVTGVFAGIVSITAVILNPYLSFYSFENIAIKIVLVIFAILWSLYFLLDFIGLSLYLYKLVLIKNIIFLGLRFVFLGIFVFLEIPSVILLVIGISELIAVIVTFILLKRKVVNLRYSFKSAFQGLRQIKEMVFFSFDNYIADLLLKSVNYITPLIIGVLLSEASAGYFFISWQLTILIYTIPTAISSSLLIQISYKSQDAQKRALVSLYVSLITSVIAILIVAFLGKYILLLYGASYAENSYFLLLFFAFSSIPHSYILIKVSELRHNNKSKLIILINAILVGVYFACFFIFLNLNYHINSFGIGWFIGTTTSALLIAFTEVGLYIRKYIHKTRVEPDNTVNEASEGTTMEEDLD